MKGYATKLISGVVLAAALALVGGVMAGPAPAYAQLHRGPAASNAPVAADVYKVSYFDVGTQVVETGAAVGDAIVPTGGDGEALVRVVNPTSTPIICEMTYVFDAREELQECCGCPVTNDGLRVQRTVLDLTSNPDNGVPFVNGVIKIISSLPNEGPECNPALPLSLTPALRAWSTHVESSGEVVSVSVESFSDAPLDQTELNNDVATCAFIHTNSTGHGICTCGTGDDFPAGPRAGR